MTSLEPSIMIYECKSVIMLQLQSWSYILAANQSILVITTSTLCVVVVTVIIVMISGVCITVYLKKKRCHQHEIEGNIDN